MIKQSFSAHLFRLSLLALGLASCSLAQPQATAKTAMSVGSNALFVTTIAIGASPNPAQFGVPVTITATVTPVQATGKITFYDRTTFLGIAPVVNGTATFTTVALSSGLRSLVARYDGDSNYQASSSGVLRQGIVTRPGSGFSAPSFIPAGAGSQAIVTADMNGDGKADLVVSNFENNGISIYLGTGNGAFLAPAATLTDSEPSAMATGDFNGDGKLDVAVGVSGGVDILIGNGDGTFQPAVKMSLSSAPSSLTVADLNKDGIVDLIAGSVTGVGVVVMLGNGDGTFQTGSTYTADSGVLSVATGDFDGDGSPDVVAATTSGSSVLLGNGDGTLKAFTFYAAGSGSQSVAVRDLNGDGNLDFAIANYTDGTVSVLLGRGDGTFLAGVAYAAGTHPVAVTTGDFNGDIRPDLIVADQTAVNGQNVNVLLGNGDGTFKPALGFQADAAPQALAVADFNGDGEADAVTVSAAYSDLSILLNGSPAVSISQGNTQSAQENNTFGQAIQVVAYGFGVPMQNVSVTFVAPSSGAGGFFDGAGTTATVVTGEDGSATAPLYTANGTPGAQIVTASAGGNTVTFNLSNAVQPCSFSVTPASLLYDASGGAVSFQVVASGPNCAWSAASTSPLPHFGSTGGVGNGTVSVLLPANTSGSPQNATLLVAGQWIPVSLAETVQVFADVPVTAYYFDAVNQLKAKGITSGCSSSPLDYCPNNAVTRVEAAIMLVRSVYGGDDFTASQQPYFNDVGPDSFGFAWVQKLYELGITQGCGNNDFCPNDVVTRDQMAMFVIRARYGATTMFDYSGTPVFTDVPTNYFAFRWIQRLSEDQITSGCAPSMFCPTGATLRGDMALFLMRGEFNQFLPGGTPVISQISPAAITRGQTVTVTVTGSGTAFLQGTTLLNSIPGVSAENLQVTSPTTFTVDLTPSLDAAAQPYSIWVATGPQEAVLPNGLTLQ